MKITGAVTCRRAIGRLVLALCLAAHAQVRDETLKTIQAMVRARQYNEALQMSKTALARSPRDYRVWALRGITFSLQGNGKPAMEAFDKALSISPGYMPALQGEAQLLYPTRDKRVVPILERILMVAPQDVTAHEMLAMVDQGHDDCTSAIPHFLASAEIVETHPRSLEAYAKCLAQAGDPEKALAAFDRLSTLLPERAYPRYDSGLLLVEMKKYGDAVKILGPLAEANPSDAEILSLASEAYEGTGDTPKAVALLRDAIVLSPTTPDYYTRFASLSLTHESFQVGIDMVAAGIDRLPNDASLYISRGLLYAQLAQYDRAEADFKKAEALDSKQSITSYALDLSQLQKNDNEGALEQIRAQLRLHPDSALLHYLLGKLLFDQGTAGNSDEVLSTTLAAVKLQPNLLEPRDLLANIYLRAGQYDLATEQCRAALQYDGDDQVAIYHLIVALRHANSAEAHEEIQTLVKRLAVLQESSRKQEIDRKRFKLVEEQTVPPS